MLSYSVFKIEMQRLANAFGESNRDKFDRRMEVYFEELRNSVNDQQINLAVSHLVRHGERFPSIKRILDAASQYVDQGPKKYTESCMVCDGSGIVKALDREQRRYLFRCASCTNGPRAYPEWSNKCFDLGYRPEGSDVGWDANDETQAKGLVFLGEESAAFSKAPPETQAKARALIQQRKGQRQESPAGYEFSSFHEIGIESQERSAIQYEPF